LSDLITRSQKTSDHYVLNWKSSYDMLFMCQSRQQHFGGF